jgi:hypothetical protein
MVPLVVVFGNVWRVLNPWRAAADAVAWVTARLGVTWEPLARYPERLGRWPAAALLFAFTAYELAYLDASEPRSLALAILIYSWITWVGTAVFGRETWFDNCEAFSAYFGFLSRIAPVGARERNGTRELVLRPPLKALTNWDDKPGSLAVVAVMLGSVAFDGFSRASWWQDSLYDLEARYIVDSPRTADLVATGFNLLGLALAVGAVALLFLTAVWAARQVSGSREGLAQLFVGSLVPIALAYSVAHYFTLLINQGQFAIPLASDPFGKGWDLFGTDGFQPSLFNSPNAIWYTQVAVLVVGHVLGLALAHDRAVAIWGSARTAVRTQYAMLALMVLYTCTGLWLLSAN